jgi:6-phosphogluconolactonase
VEFVRRAREAGQARGVFTIAPAGGSTPKSVCALLTGDGEGSFRVAGKVMFMPSSG